jgi:hypothetical protein
LLDLVAAISELRHCAMFAGCWRPHIVVAGLLRNFGTIPATANEASCDKRTKAGGTARPIL